MRIFKNQKVTPMLDREWDQLGHELEQLDQFLRVQNLRRAEEEKLIRLIEGGNPKPRLKQYVKSFSNLGLVSFLFLLMLQNAEAASLEGTLSNLVNSFVGRILPILALGYLGKNIFGHVQGDPNARTETIRVVVAATLLLAINGVWAYIRQQVQ